MGVFLITIFVASVIWCLIYYFQRNVRLQNRNHGTTLKEQHGDKDISIPGPGVHHTHPVHQDQETKTSEPSTPSQESGANTQNVVFLTGGDDAPEVDEMEAQNVRLLIEIKPSAAQEMNVDETDDGINNLSKVLSHLKPLESKWHELGIHLGIKKETLNSIEADHHHVGRRLSEVVSYWQRNKREPSWEKLADAVDNVGGHSNLVRSIRRESGVDPNTTELGCDSETPDQICMRYDSHDHEIDNHQKKDSCTMCDHDDGTTLESSITSTDDCRSVTDSGIDLHYVKYTLTSEPDSAPITEPFLKPVSESTSVSQPTSNSASITEPFLNVSESMSDSVSQPTSESATITEPLLKPVSESTSDSVSQPTSESVTITEPLLKPVSASVSESATVTEPFLKPVLESVSASVSASESQPASESESEVDGHDHELNSEQEKEVLTTEQQQLLKDEDFPAVLRTAQNLKDETSVWKSKRDLTLKKLEEIKKSLEKSYHGCTIAKVSGASAAIVGSGLAIAGFGLSFVTFGATLALTIAGASIAGAGIAAGGGIAMGGAEIGNWLVSRSHMKEVDSVIQQDREASTKIREHAQKMTTLVRQLSGRYPSLSEDEIFTVISNLMKDGHAARILHGSYKVLNAGFGIGSTIFKVGHFTSTGIGAAKIAWTGINTVAGGLSIAGVIFDAVALPFDFFVLVKGAIDIHKYNSGKGSNCKKANQVEEMIKDLEKHKNYMLQIESVLQES